MILNLYYKLLWWYAAIRAERGQSKKVDQFKACNGTWYTYISCAHPSMSDDAHYIQKSLFAGPYNGMCSQTALIDRDSNNYYYYGNLIVGSGNTPVTAEDYKIENEIVDGLSCSAAEVTIDDDARSISFRKILTNTSDVSITIREVGYTTALVSSTGGTFTYGVQGLLYREVLDEPLVIGAGETGTVVVTINHVLPA